MESRNPYLILQVQPSAVPEVVEAAYRALALLHHPDRGTGADGERTMAELNWAYATIREHALEAARAGHAGPTPTDAASVSIEVEPEADAPTTLRQRVAVAAEAAIQRDAANPGNTVLDFGRYAGMTLRQIARLEPGYLEWLRRHSSGLRYRSQIDEVLGALYTRQAPAAEA